MPCGERLWLCATARSRPAKSPWPRPARLMRLKPALPLHHEGRRVGALLLRFKDDFEQSDSKLLFAVGAQLARNLQREEVRKKKAASDSLNFVSAHAAGRRLEAFDVVGGLLTEQRFGANVLAEASVAYGRLSQKSAADRSLVSRCRGFSNHADRAGKEL